MKQMPFFLWLQRTRFGAGLPTYRESAARGDGMSWAAYWAWRVRIASSLAYWSVVLDWYRPAVKKIGAWKRVL